MEKTKFGVSAALISMLCYFTGYMNFTACIILLVAALVWSDSMVAKKNAAQAAVLAVFFSVISIILNWLSGAYMNIITTVFTNWFDLYKVYEVLSKGDIMGWLSGFLGFVELVLMIVFVFISLKGKVVKIPLISKMIDKHFGDGAEATAATEETATEATATEATATEATATEEA